ncbi:N-acetyltransferase family protein [Ramlibacter sp. AN1015]|uniref:GNAT family N-acetyltransferase n=1 Tax=Ramlibacter sp. AN1015 TaxID=3133428 RepID=UPI0030C5276F
MTADHVSVRQAEAQDVPAITALYRHYVLGSTCTFETQPPDPGAMSERVRAVQQLGLPWLVAQEPAGRLVGYAYAARYRERAAYRHTIENSVYVCPTSQRAGIGSRLLSELIARASGGDFLQMVAIIGDSRNAASVALHARHGFRKVGVLEDVGFKLGQWLDTVIMQRGLG